MVFIVHYLIILVSGKVEAAISRFSSPSSELEDGEKGVKTLKKVEPQLYGTQAQWLAVWREVIYG